MNKFRIEIGEEAVRASTANRQREMALARENNPLPYDGTGLNNAALAGIDALLLQVSEHPGRVSPEELAGAF
jgi:hypothetical protein